MSGMSFPAKIVLKDDGRWGFNAGFASKTAGKTVCDYGTWYGTQMSYRPFTIAEFIAKEHAEELNSLSGEALKEKLNELKGYTGKEWFKNLEIYKEF
jgi:hypothetical protein